MMEINDWLELCYWAKEEENAFIAVSGDKPYSIDFYINQVLVEVNNQGDICICYGKFPANIKLYIALKRTPNQIKTIIKNLKYGE